MAPQHDPIVATALSASGRTPDTIPWRNGVVGGEATVRDEATGAALRIEPDHAWVRWEGDGPRWARYSVHAGRQPSHELRLSGTAVPETTIAALAGEPLARLVDLPGDPGFLIERIHVETLGEFIATVVALAMPGEDATHICIHRST